MYDRLIHYVVLFFWLTVSCWRAAALVSTNVIDFGATPSGSVDDAPAFQAAFDALEAAGGGLLVVPEGNYLFDSRVELSGDNTSGARLVTIQGDGGATKLYSRNSTNGIFRFSYTTRSQQVNLYDLTFIALQQGAGTALEVSSPPGGAQDKRVVTVENVTVRGQVGGDQYFDQGIVVTGVYRPLIKNCSVIYTDGPDMSDSSSNFVAQTGIDVSDCYAPVIQDCTVSAVHTAYRYSTTISTNATGVYTNCPEDGAVMDSVADYCRVGIQFHQNYDGVEPTFWVRGCDINARDIGVWVKGRRICHITDNEFNQRSSSYALNDVQFDNVHLGFVLRNTFNGTLASGRKNVVVDEDGSYIIIKTNTLSGAASSALQIDPSADNILLQ